MPTELYSRSKLILSSQIRSDILMNLKKRSRSSSQAYLTLIFPSSSQWSDVNLSSWEVHKETKSLYWKEGVLRAFAFFFSSFSRGHCTTLDLTMNLSSHQIIVSWKERSRSDMPVNLILIFSLRSLWWADLDLNFLNFIQLCCKSQCRLYFETRSAFRRCTFWPV